MIVQESKTKSIDSIQKTKTRLKIFERVVMGLSYAIAFIFLIYFIVTGSNYQPYLLLLGSLSGIISVYYSNKKSAMFFLFGTLATLFKLIYPIVQIMSGSTMINYSPLIGQLIFMGIGIFQWLNWKKDDKGYVSKLTSKAIASLSIVLFIGWWLISGLLQHNAFAGFVDSLGSVSYDLGVVLMSVNSILCFYFFIISDIVWMIFSINDIVVAKELIMIIYAVLMAFQVIIYILLAVVGIISWKIMEWEKNNDDGEKGDIDTFEEALVVNMNNYTLEIFVEDEILE